MKPLIEKGVEDEKREDAPGQCGRGLNVAPRGQNNVEDDSVVVGVEVVPVRLPLCGVDVQFDVAVECGLSDA